MKSGGFDGSGDDARWNVTLAYAKDGHMGEKTSFKDTCIVSCGTMRPELEVLQREGFLDAARVFFTAPGLHEWPRELAKQLPRQIEKAKQHAKNIIVVYGERCFMDSKNPMRVTQALIDETCPEAVRINAATCVDMLADARTREDLARGDRVWWCTPGWIKNWDFIFKHWDKGQANEMFPGHDRAVVLDGIGYFNRLMEESPEEILRISDWMNLPIESADISLERFKALLADAAAKLRRDGGKR